MPIQHNVYSVIFGEFSPLYLLLCLIGRVHFPSLYFTSLFSKSNTKEKLQRALFASIDRFRSSFNHPPGFNPFALFCARGIKHRLGVLCTEPISSFLSSWSFLQNEIRVRSRIHSDIVSIWVHDNFPIHIQHMHPPF